jgi:enoyl-CoA hydratase
MTAVERVNELLCDIRGRAGVITLNRPEALNSLNLPMLGGMLQQLRSWARDDRVKVVVVRGAGGKAFCAGGDVRAVYEARGDADFMDRVYRVEYELDEYISRYPKPYVALMTGYTMGGGCGISVHGAFRVVTETTVVAMPEVSIGLFPDVAGSCFLSRCPGATGLYAGLTGARLSGADAMYLGLADYFIPAARLDELVDTIARSGEAHAALQSLTVMPPRSEIAVRRSDIDACFSRDTVAGILSALHGLPADWARDAERAMLADSPTSLEITLRAIREGASKSLQECLVTDFRIAQRLMTEHDYFEGTRALIIDKDRRPRWNPATLAQVDPKWIDHLVSPLDERELEFESSSTDVAREAQ